MVPERSKVGSRRPLDSSLGAGTLPRRRQTPKRRPFWSQNWPKIGQKSTKNRKNTDSKTNFEFDTIFGSIFDQILIDFEAKIREFFDQILR